MPSQAIARERSSGISSPFEPLSPSRGQVTHVLLTRTPLNALLRPLDLHVLGTPPTFVLSQDQTRQLIWPDLRRSRFAVGFATAYLFFHPARTPSESCPKNASVFFCLTTPPSRASSSFLSSVFKEPDPDDLRIRLTHPLQHHLFSEALLSAWEGRNTACPSPRSTRLCALFALFCATRRIARGCAPSSVVASTTYTRIGPQHQRVSRPLKPRQP